MQPEPAPGHYYDAILYPSSVSNQSKEQQVETERTIPAAIKRLRRELRKAKEEEIDCRDYLKGQNGSELQRKQVRGYLQEATIYITRIEHELKELKKCGPIQKHH